MEENLNEPKKEKKQNAFAALMSGSLLTQDSVIKHLPFLLFLYYPFE